MVVELNVLFQILLTAGLLPSCFLLVRRLSQIRDNLAALNSRLVRLETRVDAHERQDDERHAAEQKDSDSLWEAISELRRRPGHALCRLGRQALGLPTPEN